jgi:hypothetical protein
VSMPSYQKCEKQVFNALFSRHVKNLITLIVAAGNPPNNRNGFFRDALNLSGFFCTSK